PGSRHFSRTPGSPDWTDPPRRGAARTRRPAVAGRNDVPPEGARNMNRYLASSLGMTLGLLASAGRADDAVVWRAARDRTPQPTSAVPDTKSSWVRARAQDADPPPLPGVEALPPPRQPDGPSLPPGTIISAPAGHASEIPADG